MSIRPQTPSAPVMKRFARLFDILQYRRPAGSKSENRCINQFIRRVKGVKEHKGGFIVEVLPKTPHGALQWRSETMFSCHTDTVHHAGGTQDIFVDEEMGFIWKKDGEPLGADDGAGMWIMLEMIDAGVPGTYVFHRAEEVGGIGSSWFAENMPEFFKRFKRAVAFDRRAEHSVITWQRGGECCSNEFANALAAALNEKNGAFEYRPDGTGIFTDTANYTHLIPECTNLSVGYHDEHSGKETLDFLHLVRLRDACVALDWERLPTHREAKPRFTYSWPSGGYIYKGSASKDTTPNTGHAGFAPTLADAMLMTKDDLEVWAMEFPDEVAAMLYGLLHTDGEEEVAEETTESSTTPQDFFDRSEIIELGGQHYMDDGNGNLVKVHGAPAQSLVGSGSGSDDVPF